MTIAPRQRLPIAALGLITALLIGLISGASAGADPQPIYEPNDTLPTAYGPLLPGKYSAVNETSNDKDIFYFYVTSPSTAQLTMTLRNFGGGTSSESVVEAEIKDSHGYEIQNAYDTSVEAWTNNYATTSVTLGPNKYYIEVTSGSGYGDNYTLEVSGTNGAFTDYAPIASQCAAATAAVTSAQGVIAVNQGKVKRANIKVQTVRRRRHHTRRALRKVKAKLAIARSELAAANESYKVAAAGQRPWCEIPA